MYYSWEFSSPDIDTVHVITDRKNVKEATSMWIMNVVGDWYKAGTLDIWNAFLEKTKKQEFKGCLTKDDLFILLI